MKINNYEVEQTIIEETGITCYSYFACTCEEEDKKFWGEALTNYSKGTEVDIDSVLIMDLTHTYHAGVTGIGCDMWFGISISAGYGSFVGSKFVYDKECELYIQCDELSHGLLAAVMILKDLGYDEE
jgi:hypothetical protein